MSRTARAMKVGVLVATLSGCPAIPIIDRAMSTEAQRKETFEKGWNSIVGRYRDVPRYHKEVLLETRAISAGATEYVIRQKHECRIGLLVNNADSTISAWRYVSDPKQCWEYYRVE